MVTVRLTDTQARLIARVVGNDLWAAALAAAEAAEEPTAVEPRAGRSNADDTTVSAAILRALTTAEFEAFADQLITKTHGHGPAGEAW